jgi:hypothetical protein
MHVVNLDFLLLHFSLFLLFPSNVEIFAYWAFNICRKTTHANDPFILSELHPVLLCVRAIHTFYCLPCFFFFFIFVSFFFAIRITTVHIENQTNKKSRVLSFLSFLSFVFKQKYFRWKSIIHWFYSSWYSSPIWYQLGV